MLFLCLMSTLCITPENELSASELGPVQYVSSNEMLLLGGHFINFCPWSTSEDPLYEVLQKV